MTYYEECEICKSDRCTEDCFNRHVGSIVALQKLLKECGTHGTIITDKEIVDCPL